MLVSIILGALLAAIRFLGTIVLLAFALSLLPVVLPAVFVQWMRRGFALPYRYKTVLIVAKYV
jgi:hypothetical protein